MSQDPVMLTTSTNRHAFQPTKVNKRRRRSEIQDEIRRGKDGSRSASKDGRSAIAAKLSRIDSASESSPTVRSQLVDLVVEDTDAEEAERVRARKEGGPAWNLEEQKHFIRTYGDEDLGEEFRQGFDPDAIKAADSPPVFAVSENADDGAEAEGSTDHGQYGQYGQHGQHGPEHNPWHSPGRPT